MKTLFTDIDGTFLQGGYFGKQRRKFEPSSKLIDTVQQFHQLGGEIIFASGRRESSVRKLEMKTGLKPNYCISMNGAFVHSPSGELIRKRLFTNQEINRILDFIYAEKLYEKVRMTMFYTDDTSLGYSKPMLSNGFGLLSKAYGSISLDEIEQLRSREDMIKVVFLATKDNIDIIRNILSKLDMEFEMFCSSSVSLELCAKGANKGDALKYVCSLKGIEPSKVAFTGDSENDIAALSVVGFPIAMKDGRKSVKSVSKLIVDDVVEALEYLMKNY